MDITDFEIQEMNGCLRVETPPYHFIAGMFGDWMLYGTGTAQLAYLAVMDAVALVLARQAPSVTRQLINSRYRVHSGHKELNPSVSNYFVKVDRTTVTVERTGNQQAPINLTKGVFDTPASEQFFDRFKASPQSLDDLSYAKLVGGMKKHYGDAPDHPSLRDYATQDLIRYYAVRRSCKFLIYDSISQGKTIRYVLDDLNLEMAATKARVDGKVPVCTSELREMFRYWDSLDGDIQFYKEFRRVPPPWESPPATADAVRSWATYAAHLANKRINSGRGSAAFEHCIERFVARDWEGTINAYFLAGPSIAQPPQPINLGATPDWSF